VENAGYVVSSTARRHEWDSFIHFIHVLGREKIKKGPIFKSRPRRLCSSSRQSHKQHNINNNNANKQAKTVNSVYVIIQI